MTSPTPLLARTRRVLRLTSIFNPTREQFARYFPSPFGPQAEWRRKGNPRECRPAGKLTRGSAREPRAQ